MLTLQAVADNKIGDCILLGPLTGFREQTQNVICPQCCGPPAFDDKQLSSQKQTIMVIEFTSVNKKYRLSALR